MKTKRVFNNDKVESHSAITPTYLRPKKLTGDEQIVYTAIKNRFIMQFMPIAEYEETKLQTKLEGQDGLFISKGRVQLAEGWKKVENIQPKEAILPFVQENETVSLIDSKISSHVTKPPKQHTEKTLLRVMETCGKGYKDEENEEELANILAGFSIGTPATRAETIKKLKEVGYISVKGKNLECTHLGRKLVETFPVKSLFDLEFTGRLEKSLSDIQKGMENKSAFLKQIFTFTNQSVERIKADQQGIIKEIPAKTNTEEIIGKCPACGNDVIDAYIGFTCRDWKKGCDFIIWKNDKYLAALRKKPGKTMVKQLLKNNKTYVKGLTSKKGKKFNAYLRYIKNKDNDYYSWEMTFRKKSGR